MIKRYRARVDYINSKGEGFKQGDEGIVTDYEASPNGYARTKVKTPTVHYWFSERKFHQLFKAVI